jgi:dimethylhistidine N-methyltransferase
MAREADARAPEIPLHDLHPEPEDMRAEVVSGLSNDPKTLPCKYFYDGRGSKLFDRICELDEYYPTRTEIGILERRAEEIGNRLGDRALLVELGSGSSTKTHVLLRALSNPVGYVPVDISRDHLREAANRIVQNFPNLAVRPVCADFNEPFTLPPDVVGEHERVVFFPGSTIGNFDRDGRLALLERIADLCQPRGGSLLLGIDLVKDTKRLEAAYNDAKGVTADFNRNLLLRINRDLGADFEIDRFEHRAIFAEEHQRIEMYLVSAEDQQVAINGSSFRFRGGETICTEHSYKFTIRGFSELSAQAGWTLDEVWTDDDDLFAILLLRMKGRERV